MSERVRFRAGVKRIEYKCSAECYAGLECACRCRFTNQCERLRGCNICVDPSYFCCCFMNSLTFLQTTILDGIHVGCFTFMNI